jgi:isopentenyl-diphosphate Delta-isomerase
MALPFLQAAHDSDAALQELVEILTAELTTALLCSGAASLEALRIPGRLQPV